MTVRLLVYSPNLASRILFSLISVLENFHRINALLSLAQNILFSAIPCPRIWSICSFYPILISRELYKVNFLRLFFIMSMESHDKQREENSLCKAKWSYYCRINAIRLIKSQFDLAAIITKQLMIIKRLFNWFQYHFYLNNRRRVVLQHLQFYF